MSIRCSSTSLIPGAIVCGVPGLGVIGSTILATTGSGGSGPGILFNDVQTGDENKEFRAEVLTWPSAGSIDLQEDGRFTYTGPSADALTYRLWVDGVSIGTASVSLYGSGVTVADVGAVGAMSWSAIASSSVTISSIPTAAVSGVGAMSWAASGTASVTVVPMTVTAAVAASGAMSWAGTGAVSANILPPVAADAAGAAAMAWAASGAASVTVVDPAAVQAAAAGQAAMAWSAAGAVLASILDPVAADVQGAAAMSWSARGYVITDDGSIVWPSHPSGITHRAIVAFPGVRAIVQAGDTAMVVKTFDKQPRDVEVYEIDFDAKYLAGADDTAQTLLDLASDAGITVTPEVPVGGALSSGVVRVRVSGGTDGQDYKITARISTTGGREKEADIGVKVAEI